MATKKDQTDEEILKELHGNDSSGSEEEEEAIDISKIKSEAAKK